MLRYLFLFLRRRKSCSHDTVLSKRDVALNKFELRDRYMPVKRRRIYYYAMLSISRAWFGDSNVRTNSIYIGRLQRAGDRRRAIWLGISNGLGFCSLRICGVAIQEETDGWISLFLRRKLGAKDDISTATGVADDCQLLSNTDAYC